MVFSFLLAGGSVHTAQTVVSAQRTVATPDATLKAVTAAKAFLSTLDCRQQAAVVLPLNKDTRSRWSNLPNGAGGIGFERNGLKLGDLTAAQQQAALKFIQWITSPERAAQWGIDTGYVAVRPDAWETPVMKRYVEGFPAAAVARDQLPYAVAELSTHDNQRVTKALNDGIQAALTGTKQPDAAMKDSQAEAERILRGYR